MSVGVGVSDILFFVNQTLILYGKCKGAPVELHAAGRNVEQMRTALEILGAAIEDKQSFVTRLPAVTLMIKHEMKPLKEDLLAMNLMLDDYIDKSKGMGVMGRVKYAVLDRDKLQNIQSHLTRSRTNFSLMLDLVNMKAQDQHARNGQAITKKLEAILDKQTKEADARRNEVKATEKGHAQLENILHILEERLPVATKSEVENQSQVLDQLEQELQRLGLPKEKAQAARFNAAQALKGNAPVQDTLHPNKPQNKRPTSSSPQPKQELRRSSSARNPAAHPPNLPEKTKHYRILCLDSIHGIRAVLAHAYLEVLRVWTANRTGRWLFSRVHSAGRNIETNPNASIDPTAIRGVAELLPQDTYEWAKGFPIETQRILRRMKDYHPCGFTKSDLSTYDIILCFRRTDANDLSQVQIDGQRARVIVLPGCGDISSDDCANDPAKIKVLISNIKTAVKGFISEELGDWTIELKRNKDFRTLQMVLPTRETGSGASFATQEKVTEWAQKSGCLIRVSNYKASTKQVLVSIVGPKEHLDETETLIRKGI